jgi:hypothetical protein
MPGPAIRALLMGLAWAVNIALAEWVIRRRTMRLSAPRPAVA